MATKVKCIVVTRWKSTPGNNDPAILDDLPRVPGISVTDVTGQEDRIIPPKPNVYICEVDGLTPAQFTTLNGRSGYHVLMSETYDDQTGIVSASTYDDRPTAGQLTTFVNTLKTRFPDVDDDKLTDAGRAAFRAGLSRREIVGELIKRWRKFEKNNS